MEATTAALNNGRLAWAVLCKTPSGKGEVVRVTDHEDADAAVRENPELFWKSGPFVLPY
jgi:hypothetical protein